LAGTIAVKTTTNELTKKTSKLDQSILAKAFRGELVPQDPNDEPASALLRRIEASKAQRRAKCRVSPTSKDEKDPVK
jgi:type I restriction enzyme S subunit